MAIASGVLPGPVIRLPHVTLPRPRLPHLSRRTRALLMIGLMVSPAFLSDAIGYGVKRLFYTADQVAEMRVPDSTTFTHLNIFHVACADDATPPARERWADFAARRGWPMYPQAGPTCFRPDQVLIGFVGLKNFNVACPTVALSVADRRQWMDYAANHGWPPYPQAGTDCVDP